MCVCRFQRKPVLEHIREDPTWGLGRCFGEGGGGALEARTDKQRAEGDRRATPAPMGQPPDLPSTARLHWVALLEKGPIGLASWRLGAVPRPGSQTLCPFRRVETLILAHCPEACLSSLLDTEQSPKGETEPARQSMLALLVTSLGVGSAVPGRRPQLLGLWRKEEGPGAFSGSGVGASQSLSATPRLDTASPRLRSLLPTLTSPRLCSWPVSQSWHLF